MTNAKEKENYNAEKKKSIWCKEREAPSSPKSVKAMTGEEEASMMLACWFARSALSSSNHEAWACKLGCVLRLSSLKGDQKALLLYLLEQVLMIARGWEVAIPFQRQVNMYVHLPWLVLWVAPLESMQYHLATGHVCICRDEQHGWSHEQDPRAAVKIVVSSGKIYPYCIVQCEEKCTHVRKNVLVLHSAM